MASSSSNDRKKHVGSKSMEMEEIVKYMSSLPSYLERGKPIQDRALNFGVLDWGRLEQWQYHNQIQGVNKSNKYLPSSSNSTNKSSVKPPHVTLQSHLNISPEEISTKYGLVNHSSDKKTTTRSRTKPKGFKKNDLNPQNVPESKSSDDTRSFQTASSSSSSKGKMKIQYELVDEPGNLQYSRHNNQMALSIENKKGNEKNSQKEANSERNLEEKELSVSSKNSDFKMGTIENKKINAKNSRNEANSQRNLEKKELTVSSKNSDMGTTENKKVNEKNSWNEINSQRNLEEKEFSVSSKNPDFKMGSKHRFSFNMSSKSATKAVECPEDAKIKAKVKMDLRNCKEVRVDNSCRNKMNDRSSSKKKAIFQMAIKSGRPLFTFTVDDKHDILAATVRSLSTKDDTNSWIYTFFTIHEVKKKKSGWLYHGTKDKGHGYLPNVTAQMKVSNSSISNCTTREFVLSSVDSGQTDHQILDGQPENELAAIFVRFLRKDNEEENQDSFETTVILPGGHHGVPRKGEPSPLIERWRSGGRCDCGGWDVGCRLRTLTNKVQSNSRLNPSESFDLFFEEDVPKERPFFSLSQLKEGIFSVEYDSSLPLLHAFSICITVVECRKSSHHTELRSYVAKQADEDDDDGDDYDYDNDYDYDDEGPVIYASLPPVSPVGRV